MSLSTLLKPRGITELGKIKIGRKAAQERGSGDRKWRAPEKVDHFLITTMSRGENGDLEYDDKLMTELSAEYGDEHDKQLRSLPIMLMSNDIEDCMQSRWCWYPGKTLGASSDGNTVRWFVDPKTKRKLNEPRVEEWTEGLETWKYNDKDAGFKLHTIFSCVIAAQTARYGGVYKFRTTSRISAEQMYSSLLNIKDLTGGALRGVPLTMVVRPMQVNPDGRASTVYVVHIEMRGGDLKQIQRDAIAAAQHRSDNALELQRHEEQYRKLLRAPGDQFEDPAESADVADEFHPTDVTVDAEIAADDMDAEGEGIDNLEAFHTALKTCTTSEATKAIFDTWLRDDSPLTEAEQIAAGAAYQGQLDAQVQVEKQLAEQKAAAEEAKKEEPKEEETKYPSANGLIKRIMATKETEEVHRMALKAIKLHKEGVYSDDEVSRIQLAAEAADERLVQAATKEGE